MWFSKDRDDFQCSEAAPSVNAFTIPLNRGPVSNIWVANKHRWASLASNVRKLYNRYKTIWLTLMILDSFGNICVPSCVRAVGMAL